MTFAIIYILIICLVIILILINIRRYHSDIKDIKKKKKIALHKKRQEYNEMKVFLKKSNLGGLESEAPPLAAMRAERQRIIDGLLASNFSSKKAKVFEINDVQTNKLSVIEDSYLDEALIHRNAKR